jgi:hypothetical protein
MNSQNNQPIILNGIECHVGQRWRWSSIINDQLLTVEITNLTPWPTAEIIHSLKKDDHLPLGMRFAISGTSWEYLPGQDKPL